MQSVSRVTQKGADDQKPAYGCTDGAEGVGSACLGVSPGPGSAAGCGPRQKPQPLGTAVMGRGGRLAGLQRTG